MINIFIDEFRYWLEIKWSMDFNDLSANNRLKNNSHFKK